MAKDNSKEVAKNYKDALKSAEGIVIESEKANKSTNIFKDTLNDISTSFLGISGSDFFKNVEKTPQDLAESAKEILKIKKVISEADNVLENDFKKHAQDLLDVLRENKSLVSETRYPSIDDVLKDSGIMGKQFDLIRDRIEELNGDKGLSGTKDSIKQLLEDMKDSANQDMFKGIDKDKINELVKKTKMLESTDLSSVFGDFGGVFEELSANFDPYLIKDFVDNVDDLSGFIKKNGEEAKKMLATLTKNNPQFLKSLEINQKIIKPLKQQVDVLKQSTKETFNLMDGFSKLSTNVFAGMKTFLLEYDSAISKAQKDTGIMFKENNAAMAQLTSKTASLGMSVGDTAQMMGELGDELNTTDFGVLSKATSDFAAISGALGVSSGEITTIAGEMMRMGSSSEAVKESFQDTNVLAKQLGVNSKRVVQQIEKNITKMREFGFTGGVKSLQKMAVEAERLRINVDEIFNVAKKARSIEGAMEMAAELQLAGGSFSNINPMDLLSAARKGPEELGKILTKMGGDIGKFDKETGEFKFDPVDVDRLNIVAEATGMSLDALQNVIMKNAEDSRKTKFFSDQMFDFPSMSADQKKMLTSLTDIDKNGKVTFKADSKTLNTLSKAGVNTTDLSKLTSKQMEAVAEAQKEEAENLEAQNKNNASLNEAIERFKGSFMAIFALFEPLISWLAEVIGGFAQWIGELGPTAKMFAAGALGLLVVLPTLITFFGGFLTKFGGIAKSMVSGIGGLVKGEGISGFMGKKGGPAVSQKEMVPGTEKSGGLLGSLADGFKSWGKNAGQILKGVGTFVLSMGIIAGGVAVIAMVLSMLPPTEMEKLLPLGIALVALGGSVFLLSKIKTDTSNLIKMSLAMAIVGAALIPFAFAAQMLNGIDFTNVLLSLGLLTLVVLGLTLLGALMSGPQIVALAIGVGILVSVSAGLLIFSASLLLASVAFEKLAQIDWTGFSAMGGALLAVIPGLLGFAVASMAFANPLTLLGIIMMTGALVGLTAVMLPLASSLGESSEGFATFASNMGLLSEAVAKFDVDKFERITNASGNMAASSSDSGIGSMIGNLLGANGGGSSSGGGQTMTHEIILKTPDGRELQRLIIKDNELLS